VCALCVDATRATLRPERLAVTDGGCERTAVQHEFDGQALSCFAELLWRGKWVDRRVMLENWVVIDSLADVRVAVTMSITAGAIAEGPGWHPFLQDEMLSDDISFGVKHQCLRVVIPVTTRDGHLNAAVHWVPTNPTGSRLFEWSHPLYATWYFHAHFGPQGQNQHPANSELE